MALEARKLASSRAEADHVTYFNFCFVLACYSNHLCTTWLKALLKMQTQLSQLEGQLRTLETQVRTLDRLFLPHENLCDSSTPLNQSIHHHHHFYCHLMQAVVQRCPIFHVELRARLLFGH